MFTVSTFLQTPIRKKILLIVPATAVLATILIGIGSYRETRESVYNHTYEFMGIVLQDVLKGELENRADLLSQNLMDAIDFFVREYQREALASIDQKSLTRTGFFVITDATGKLLSNPGVVDNAEVLSELEKQRNNQKFDENQSYQAHLTGEGVHHLLVAAQFTTWDWYLYYLIPDEVTHNEISQNFSRTILIISIIMFLVVVAILQVINRFIFQRITLLKEAAQNIARDKVIEPIDIGTQDDFGELARSMETMAATLYLQEMQQQKLLRESEVLNDELKRANKKLSELQGDFDQQVQERTQSLESIQQELHENLQEMERELSSTKEKNNQLVRKLSELTLKQSDMVNSHSEVVKRLRDKHDKIMSARKVFEKS